MLTRVRISLVAAGTVAAMCAIYLVLYMNQDASHQKLAPIIDCRKVPCPSSQVPGAERAQPDPHQVTVWEEGTYSREKRASFAAQLNRNFPQVNAAAFENPVPMLVLRIQAVFPYPQIEVHLYSDRIICNRWWYRGPQEDLVVSPENVRDYGFQLVQFEDQTGSAATCETTAPADLIPKTPMPIAPNSTDQLDSMIYEYESLDRSRYENQLRDIQPADDVVLKLGTLDIQIRQLIVQRAVNALNKRYELALPLQGKKGQWDDFEFNTVRQSRRIHLTCIVGSVHCGIIVTFNADPQQDNISPSDPQGRTIKQSPCFILRAVALPSSR